MRRGPYVLMVWCDIPPDKEDDFNEYYNLEHVAALRRVPGVLSASRYVAITGGPKYLTCYELESPDVFKTKSWKAEASHGREPTEMAIKAAPRYVATRFIVNAYRLIIPEHICNEFASSDPPGVMRVGRMTIPRELESQFNSWYKTHWASDRLKVPGVIRGRRYVASYNDKGVLANPKYSVVYEFENENITQTKEWETFREASIETIRLVSHMKHENGSPGIYKRMDEL